MLPTTRIPLSNRVHRPALSVERKLGLGAEDAELVALGIGEHDPTGARTVHAAQAGQDGGTSGDQPLELLVTGEWSPLAQRPTNLVKASTCRAVNALSTPRGRQRLDCKTRSVRVSGERWRTTALVPGSFFAREGRRHDEPRAPVG